MRNVIHRLATLPRAIQGLCVAAVVFAALTVAAVAREPGGPSPATGTQPAAGPSAALAGSVASGPPETANVFFGSPTPTADELLLEGAVPEPLASALPSEERRQLEGGRFALPLKDWATQTTPHGTLIYHKPCGYHRGGLLDPTRILGRHTAAPGI